MRNAIVALTLLAGAGTLPVRADEWTKTWNVSGRPELRVEAGDASITVEGADTKTVQAKVTTAGYRIGYGEVEVIEHQTGDHVDIRIKEPNHSAWRHHSIEARIVVPKEMMGVVRTGDGSIRVRDVQGTLRLDTGDGSIEVARAGGELDAHTGDGSMHVDGIFGRLRLRTGDGSIQVSAAAGSKIGMGWDMSSGDGSITVRLPKELAADLDLRTGDGHIQANLPIELNDLGSKREFRGKLNGGGPPISIKTGDGSITLNGI